LRPVPNAGILCGAALVAEEGTAAGGNSESRRVGDAGGGVVKVASASQPLIRPAGHLLPVRTGRRRLVALSAPPSAFAPPAGRRCRQADEGPKRLQIVPFGK